MTAQTHKQFCIWVTYIGVMYMYLNDMSVVNYYLMLYIMLKVAKDGALFPDVDHYWKNVKEKTNINWVINKIIHLTGGKHRSWQTHSWDICLISGFGILYLINRIHLEGYIDRINFTVANMIVIAFYTGWISHLFSDMLTSDGVRVLCFRKKKISFVPRKLSRLGVILTAVTFLGLGCIAYKFVGLALSAVLIFIGIFLFVASIRLGNITFNTGKEWEKFVYSSARTINTVLEIITLLLPILCESGLLDKIVKLV